MVPPKYLVFTSLPFYDLGWFLKLITISRSYIIETLYSVYILEFLRHYNFWCMNIIARLSQQDTGAIFKSDPGNWPHGSSTVCVHHHTTPQGLAPRIVLSVTVVCITSLARTHTHAHYLTCAHGQTHTDRQYCHISCLRPALCHILKQCTVHAPISSE